MGFPRDWLTKALLTLAGSVLNHLLSSVRGGQTGPSPFSTLLGQMMNPANARHGDAVFTQEAFDQVMSRFLDQHQGSAPGPATTAAIDALPRRPVTEEMLDENTKQAECAICMDNVSVGEEVTSLPCRHWFHHPCVEAWLKEHDTCPVCRSGIMPKDGPADTVRSPEQAPLHDEDPVMVARRQSGTRDHPFVVPESPTASRRRPNPRRRSSTGAGEEAGGGSFTGRVRSFFGGGGGGGGSGSPTGHGSSRGG